MGCTSSRYADEPNYAGYYNGGGRGGGYDAERRRERKARSRRNAAVLGALSSG